jgi:DNA repair protein SbcD/Mre11
VEPLRLIHFADLHLGVEAGGRPNPESGLNQRIHDVLGRLDDLCEAAERDAVHAVLFCGDAFKHQHPTPTLQSLFAQRIRRLAGGGVAVFLLVGNHDLPRMASLSHPFSIYDALQVEGVTVGDRASVYRLPLRPGAPAPFLQIAALPHFSRHQVLARLGAADGDPEQRIQQAIGARVAELHAEVDASLPAVFCGHCHVDKAVVSEGQRMFGVSEVQLPMSTLVAAPSLPYYALGHLHAMQVLAREPWVAYSGSLERVDFSEGEKVKVPSDGAVERSKAEEKGFFRVDLAPDNGSWTMHGEPRFESVEARRFVTLRAGQLASDDPATDLATRVGRARDAGVELGDAFLRVTASIDGADRARLGPRVLRDLVPEAYDTQLAVDTAVDAGRVRDPRFARRMGEAEALERYLESREDWSDDRDALLRMGRELIAETT